MQITLNLPLESVNAILNVLGDLPSKTNVYPLIVEIQNQAQAQVNEANAAAAEPAATEK